jgi:hypothetical protein
MFRSLVLSLLILLLAAAALPAEQYKGKLKSVAAGKSTLTLTIGKNSREFAVPADARVVGAAGKELPQRLGAKLFVPGAQVQVTTETQDGKEIVKEVRVLDFFPATGFLDAAEAGPDFAVQGEYEGMVSGKGKLGAQVIAQEEGQFQVIYLPGGLPGAGWEGKNEVRATAKTESGMTTVAGTWTGSIADGKLTGKTADGQGFTLSRVVRRSSTEGLKPPPGAIVLFDGSNVDEWTGGQLVEKQYLLAGCRTKRTFQDFKIHMEFRLPFRDKSQGNSGVYMQERYEIQIINSFGKLPPPSNGMASIYTARAPSVNMTFPPLSWQTYDIDFKAPRWDSAGKKLSNAVVTVKHNGVTVHDAVELKNKTGNGKAEGPEPLPIHLQNHGSPVYFRNIWVVVPTPS